MLIVVMLTGKQCLAVVSQNAVGMSLFMEATV